MGTRRKREKEDYIRRVATEFINSIPKGKISYRLISVKNGKPQGEMTARFEMIDEHGNPLIFDDSTVIVFVGENGKVGFYEDFFGLS